MREHIHVVDGKLVGGDGDDAAARAAMAVETILYQALEKLEERYGVAACLNAILTIYINSLGDCVAPDRARAIIARLPAIFEATLLAHQAPEGGKQ